MATDGTCLNRGRITHSVLRPERPRGDWYSLTVFLSLLTVDSEFETVATQLLKRTQAMLNKYRCLLLEDAMVNAAASTFGSQTLQVQREKLGELRFPGVV